jgi:hypothetical protein
MSNSHSICFALISSDELINGVGKVLRLHHELVAVLALEAMKLCRSPRLPSHLQGRSVELIAKLVGNHSIIFSVHNHHWRTKLCNVLI